MPQDSRSSDATLPAPEEFSFEEALGRLEEIVDELEGGQMTLEEALKRFEEGTQLQRICLEKLRGAETRIQQVLTETATEAPVVGEDEPAEKSE